MKNKIKCPICDSFEFIKFKDLFDDRYGESNIYKISKCKCCSHLSTFPRLETSELSNLYGNFYPRKNISIEEIKDEARIENSKFSKILRWLRGSNNQGQFFVKRDQYMLDVGCGSGVSLLEAQDLGAHAFGIEADPNVKIIAEKLNLNIFFGDISEYPYKNISFDLIILNQVLEHIPEPNMLLVNLKNKLSKDGAIFISVPNTNSFWRFMTGDKWINWHVPYHLHHFNKKNLEKMSKLCGLKIIYRKTITPNIWTLMQIRTLFKNINIGEKNKLWDQSKNAKGFKKKNQNLSKTLKKSLKIILLALILVFNRTVDSLGCGDSINIILKVED